MAQTPLILSTVLPLFLMMGIGAVIRRMGWLNETADQSLMKVAVNILFPCLIFDSILGNAALRRPETLAACAWCAVAALGAGYLVFWLAAQALRVPRSVQGTLITCGAHYNNSYLPIPLCLVLFPQAQFQTLGVMMVFNVVIDSLMWTTSLAIMTGASPRQGLKNLLNGPVVAILIGLICNFLGLRAEEPGVLLKTIHTLGQCAIPLILLLIGAIICDHAHTGRPWHGTRIAAASVLLRLGLLPALFLWGAVALPLIPELRQVLVLHAAMPAAVFPIVMAKHYGGDVPTALGVVVTTTLLSLLTMTFWIQYGLDLLK